MVSVDVEPGETFLHASAKRFTKKEKIRLIIFEIYRKLIFKISLHFIHFFVKESLGVFISSKTHIFSPPPGHPFPLFAF